MRRTALIKSNNPHLAGGEKTTIPYEGLMNIRFEESSAYFSFDEKTNQCFQSFKKNISCLRMFGIECYFSHSRSSSKVRVSLKKNVLP